MHGRLGLSSVEYINGVVISDLVGDLKEDDEVEDDGDNGTEAEPGLEDGED